MNTKNINSPCLSDLYQFTMGQAIFDADMQDRDSVFHLFYRKNPFGGGYGIAAGIDPAIEMLANLKFTQDELHTLAKIRIDGEKALHSGYLDFLEQWSFKGTVHAVDEGEMVFANEPLMRVSGRYHDTELIETMSLFKVNFQTLVATKSSRCVRSAQGRSILEFGLRRAQNAMDASRAAFIGGAHATSNVLAHHEYGIPVKGTHAHLWVMGMVAEVDDPTLTNEVELMAFRKYAASHPYNCVLLVDTFDTIRGTKNAIIVGNELRQKGYSLKGIRLDSGDLCSLSIACRKLLDDAGFQNTKIIASNDLDENSIASLIHQGSNIDIFGVGTNLVTCADQPALGGVYKMGAIKNRHGEWVSTIKKSENIVKTSIPGFLQVRRYSHGGRMDCDVIYDENKGIGEITKMIDPLDHSKRRSPAEDTQGRDLLKLRIENGRLRAPVDSHNLMDARIRCEQAMKMIDPAVLRFDNPQVYPVGIEERLAEERFKMMCSAA